MKELSNAEEGIILDALTDLYATPDHTIVPEKTVIEWSIAGELDDIRHDLISLREALTQTNISPTGSLSLYWQGRLNDVIRRVTRLDDLFK